MKKQIQCMQSAKASVTLSAHTYNTRSVPVVTYVAQPLPCPREMEVTERAFLHTVLRLPRILFAMLIFSTSKIWGDQRSDP